ncbi:MAG: hypothetical protein COA41_07730 [Sphingopyxis sp.]|nr:MAG: hypothetical protein COA41_07730 [Sphingopyxis sp.]
MSWLIFLIAAPAATDRLPNYIDSQTSASVQSYGACLESASLELEPSRADFDDIFEAAKTACAGDWVDSHFSLIEDLEKLPDSSTGKSSQQIAVEFLDSIAERAKSESRLKVLRQRAGLKEE